MGAKRLVNIIYRAKGIQIPVELRPTRIKNLKEYKWRKVCPDCSESIGKKDYCKKLECINHDVLLKEEAKLTIDGKESYTKEQVENCKIFLSDDIEILGKEMKPIDKTRILDCHYILPDTRENENIGKYSMLYFGLKNSDHVLPITTGRTNKEQFGVLTVEKDVMFLFTMAFTNQIRSFPEPRETLEKYKGPLSHETQTESGIGFINSLDLFDSAGYESQTDKNYELLINGKEEEIIS